MVTTNYFSGIVKILETPKVRNVNPTTFVTTFRVEVPQTRRNKIISLLVWGNLSREVSSFYKTNDYILIEGYLSFRPQNKVNSYFLTSKPIIVTILKIYPILLTPDRA